MPGPYIYFLRVDNTCIEDHDWVARTSIKFKSQLNPKCKLISCTFQVILSVNWVLNLIKVYAALSCR
jgi:hypothetical protein